MYRCSNNQITAVRNKLRSLHDTINLHNQSPNWLMLVLKCHTDHLNRLQLFFIKSRNVRAETSINLIETMTTNSTCIVIGPTYCAYTYVWMYGH